MVDSEHTEDKATRRSRTGFLIYMNMELITWLSKKQLTTESSIFGSEFLAMKTWIEAIHGLIYKIWMMGVSLTGPSYIYDDNMSVMHNNQTHESTSKKKKNTIWYHEMRESVAMGESFTYNIPTSFKFADMLTKTLFEKK